MSANDREAHLSPEAGRPNEGPFPERRRAPRAKPTGLTYVKLEPDNGGTLLDVCESGLRFQVIAPVEDRGGIQVWFVLDPGSHIEVSGEVAWVDETKRSGGLKLTHASKQAREQLRNWISNQHPAEPIEYSKPIVDSQRTALPAAQPESASAEPPIEHDFEGQLRNLPITSPAPLEDVLTQIMGILETRHPEDIFAKPPEGVDAAQLERKIDDTLELARHVADGTVEVPGGIAQTPAQPRPPDSVRPVAATLGQAARRSAPVAAARSDQPSDFRFSEFQRSVDRVRGMLSVLRTAIVSENSDWPLTEAPEFVAPPPPPQTVQAAAPTLAAPIPPAPKPAMVAPPAPAKPRIAKPRKPASARPRAAKPPQQVPATSNAPAPPQPAPPALPVSAPVPANMQPPPVQPLSAPEPVAATQPAPVPAPVEVDVRPWSASAPWRAEAPAPRKPAFAKIGASASSSSFAAPGRFASRIFHRAAAAGRRSLVAGRVLWQEHGARIFRLFLAWLDSLRDDVVVIAHDFAPRYLRAAAARFYWLGRGAANLWRKLVSACDSTIFEHTRKWVAAVRAYRLPKSLQPSTMTRAAKNGLAATAGSAKRVSASALHTVIPAQPTANDIRIMLAVTGALLISLAGFNYRDKLAHLFSSNDGYQLQSLSIPLPEIENPAPEPAPRASAHNTAKSKRSNSAPRASAKSRSVTRTLPPAPQSLPSTASPELRNALAYLNSGRRDPATAAKWLWAASRKGDASADLLLADLYLRGDGVPQSCAQGRVLLLAASQKGNEEASRQLREVDSGACGSSGQ